MFLAQLLLRSRLHTEGIAQTVQLLAEPLGLLGYLLEATALVQQLLNPSLGRAEFRGDLLVLSPALGELPLQLLRQIGDGGIASAQLALGALRTRLRGIQIFPQSLELRPEPLHLGFVKTPRLEISKLHPLADIELVLRTCLQPLVRRLRYVEVAHLQSEDTCGHGSGSCCRGERSRTSAVARLRARKSLDFGTGGLPARAARATQFRELPGL
mmetsp:Transcript_68529/g.196566  ORF Transcript_68529/g.196566 Transcript_68529/m.196566 type:complete len:213 (+) Transcript_68529:648-1286(+)